MRREEQKPFVGGGILFIIGLAAELSGEINVTISIILLSAAGIWIFIAALQWLRFLYPSISAWIPFLQSVQYNRYVRGKTINIMDFVYGNVITDMTFDQCTIRGPAVVAAQGHTYQDDCKYMKEPIQMPCF